MAEIQIQDLPTALTPLGANDVLPVVQSGITRSVSISSGAFALTDKPNLFTSANTFSATGASYRLRLTSGAGNGKYVVYQTTGLTRWEIGSDSASETGANNGSDLVINRYDDAGNYLASPLTIERDNGLTTLEILTVPTINLGNTDTTITRSAAGVLAVEGGVIPKENRANTFTDTQTINGASLLLNSNSDYTPQTQLTHAGATAGSGAYSILNRARGTYASPTIVASGDQLGNVLFQGYDGSVYRSAASIEAQVDGTPGASDMPGRLTFKTTPDGSTVAFERMRITSAGNVGIGTAVPNAKLEIQGTSGSDLRMSSSSTLYLNQYVSASGVAFVGVQNLPMAFATNNTERMHIDASGNVLVGYTTSNGAYKLQVNSQIFATSATIATSDGNYKEDITPLNGALELVSALNPVQFSWKEHPVHNFDRAQPTVGFIAQEVQQALADTPYLNSIVKANTCTIEPEELDDEGNVTKPAVTEEFLGIAEGNMIALLTKAIQELKAEFDTYKASHP